MGIERLTHLGLCVSDLERSSRFYREVLGFEPVSRLEIAGEPAATLLGLPDVSLRARYLARDGTVLELLEFLRPGCEAGDTPRPMQRVGFTHLSFRVRDLETCLSVLEAAGGRVLDATRIELPAADTRAVFACDPDGTRLELIEAPGDPAVLPGTPESG